MTLQSLGSPASPLPQQNQETLTSSSSSFSPSFDYSSQLKDESMKAISPDIPLSKILDVSIVDTYLLQTYVVPPVVDALQQPWFQQLTTLFLSILHQRRPHQPMNSNIDNHQHYEDENMERISVLIRETIIPRLVHSMVPFLTVLFTHGITPGLRQMNLQFTSSSTGPNTCRGRNIRNKLLLYGVLKYLFPELLYPLLRYYVNSLIDDRRNQIQYHESTTTETDDSATTGIHENHRNHNRKSYLKSSSHRLQPPTSTLSIFRQQQILLFVQRILDSIDSKVIPIVNFVTLLLCWSGISAATTTNSVAMMLSGLKFNTLLSHSSSVTTSDQYPFLFYTAMAHRRWFSHHIWETIRIILLPSIAASYVIRPDVFLSSSYRSLSLALLQRIQKVVLRVRTLITTMVVPGPSIQPSAQDFNDQSPTYHNTHTNMCPFCQQVPPTITVQAYCRTCDCQHQIYCYACFYQHFCIDRNHHLYDDDGAGDDEKEYAHSRLFSQLGMTQYESSSSTNTQHPPLRRFYQIPSRRQSRNVQSLLPSCVQCHSTIDTVAFVHLKQVQDCNTTTTLQGG